jgi:hypothetical protein
MSLLRVLDLGEATNVYLSYSAFILQVTSVFTRIRSGAVGMGELRRRCQGRSNLLSSSGSSGGRWNEGRRCFGSTRRGMQTLEVKTLRGCPAIYKPSGSLVPNRRISLGQLTQRQRTDSSYSSSRRSQSRGLGYDWRIQWATPNQDPTQDTFHSQIDPSIREKSTRLKARGLCATCPSVFSLNFWDKIGRTSDWPSVWIYDLT